ncbi:MAG: hypothetical protein AAB562_01325 [Patescibacteria group bacterium]
MRHLRDIFLRICAWLRRHNALAALLVFLAALLLYLPLQLHPSFADPDSFYHAKSALLLRDRGFIHEFPWLRFTILNDPFVDHHLGYHLVLIPFVTVFPPLFGMKAAALLFAAGAVATFFFLLRRLQIPAALLWTTVVATAQPFIFRANIARAPALAEILLFLGFLALFEGRTLFLFLTTLIFVWSYNAWPVLFAALFAVILGELLVAAGGTGRRAVVSVLTRRIATFGAMSAAAAMGLIINPYFPENLAFSWLHIVGIGLRNYQDTIGVGAEWYPYAFLDLVKDAPLPFLALVFSGVLFAIGVRAGEFREAEVERRFTHIFTALILAGGFFVLTLKSRRNVEFLIPSMTLLSATVSAFVFGSDSLRTTQEALRRTPLLLAGAASFTVLLAVIGGQGITAARRDLIGGYPWSRYERAAGYLRVTLPEGATVITSDWDDFPSLFYWNDRSTYVIGLDPTYMYLYDRDLYRAWVDLTQGRLAPSRSPSRPVGTGSLAPPAGGGMGGSGDLVSVIRDRFHASAVLIDNDHEAMRNLFATDHRFERWYEDDEAAIYGIGRPPSSFSRSSADASAL